MVSNRNWSSLTCGLDRRALLLPVGDKLVQADRIDHRARQDVGADLRALLEHADRHFVVALGRELLEADRRRQPGRAAADDHHVIFHRLACHHRLALQCLFQMDAPPAGDDPSTVDSLSGAGSPPGEKGNSRGGADRIESKLFTARDFRLESGQTLPVLELAYETYGTPECRRATTRCWSCMATRRAITPPASNAAGKQGRGVRRGRGRLVRRADRAGQGGRHRSILRDLGQCARLGAWQQRTQLRSIRAPASPTGRPSPTSPCATSWRAEKLLVDSLGLKSLVAVIGPSMGGFQSFQWAASYPGFMKGDRAVGDGAALARPGSTGWRRCRSGWRAIPTGTAAGTTTTAASPETLEEIRFETLMNYGQNEILAETMPDPKAREAAIRANAKAWAQIYDGHSMVTLRKRDRHVRHHGRLRQAQGHQGALRAVAVRQAVRHRADAPAT